MSAGTGAGNGHGDNPWTELLRLTRGNSEVLHSIRQEVGGLDNKVEGLGRLVLEAKAEINLQSAEVQRHGERLTAIDGRIDALACRCADRLESCRADRDGLTNRVSRVSAETGRIAAVDAARHDYHEAMHLATLRLWGSIKWSCRIAVAAAAGAGSGFLIWSILQSACNR